MRQVNLLPEELRKVDNSKAVIVSTSITAVITIVVMLGINLAVSNYVKSIEQSIHTANRSFATPEINVYHGKIKEAQVRTESFIQEHSMIINLLGKFYSYPKILQIVGNAASGRVWIRSLKMDSLEGKCHIKGNALSTRFASEFMLEVKKNSFVQSVDIVAIKKVEDSMAGLVRFNIVINLK